jgi:hypothetical protein
MRTAKSKFQFSVTFILFIGCLRGTVSGVLGGLRSTSGSTQVVDFEHRLRSAFLCRHGLPNSHSRYAEDETESLRLHFDLIIDLLRSTEEQSLQIALNRLQGQFHQRWSDEVQRELMNLLRERRAQNLQRLMEYRHAGRFPRNDVRAQPTPIFVDRHDTACAVGYLMRMSGWEREVANVAETNNYVYITDVRDGPVRDWILRSGLTQEEAALIQPAYRDVFGRLNLIYDPTSGSVGIDFGDNVLTTLEIKSTIDFFVGPKPANFLPPFDVWTPRKAFKLVPSGFQSLSFGFGSVSIGLSAQTLFDSLSIDGTYLGGGRLGAWCLVGTHCVTTPWAGDVNRDAVLDNTDINVLTDAVLTYVAPLSPEARRYDVNFDGILSQADRRTWVDSLKRTYFGDANLDGAFDSRDLVTVFQPRQYEDSFVRNSRWETGDWDGNLEFETGDLVLAFQSGGYDLGPRQAVPVPEASTGLLFAIGLLGTACATRLRRLEPPWRGPACVGKCLVAGRIAHVTRHHSA